MTPNKIPPGLFSAVAVLAALALAGCTFRLGDLAIVSPRGVDLKADYEMVQRGVKGDDIKLMVNYLFGDAPGLPDDSGRLLARVQLVY